MCVNMAGLSSQINALISRALFNKKENLKTSWELRVQREIMYE